MRQNKSDSFGDLIEHNSHMPVFSTTSARFEFVPRKNKLAFEAGYVIKIPIYSTPSKSLPFSFSALPTSDPLLQTIRQLQIHGRKTGEYTVSKTPFITILKFVLLPFFNLLPFP